mgnify:CR=1 FL=1
MNQDSTKGPINMGNTEEFTILELAKKVIDLSGSRSKVVYKPLPTDDPSQRQPDITQAKEFLGWEPEVSLEQGLKPTIEYFDQLLSKSGA